MTWTTEPPSSTVRTTAVFSNDWLEASAETKPENKRMVGQNFGIVEGVGVCRLKPKRNRVVAYSNVGTCVFLAGAKHL